MNEQLFNSLKTKFDGVQDAILRRVAEKYGRNLGETPAEDEIQGVVDGVTFQNVLESYGDSRATEAANTAVANYKKKQGTQGGQNNPNPGQNQQNQKKEDLPDDAPEWAKSLIKQNQELSSKLEGLEKKERTKSLVETVQQKLVKGKKVPQSFFKGRNIEVNDESEIDSVVDQIAEDYNSFKKEIIEQGIVTEEPKEPLSGGSDKQVDKDIEEWAEN